MKRGLSPVVVGAFVIGAALLAVVTLLSFGAGGLFKDSYRFVVLIENSSVSGLDLGSPVKLSGVRIGRVESVTAHYEPAAGTIVVRVVCDLDADAARSLIPDVASTPDQLVHDLIAAGLHARLSYTGITGLLYVDLGIHSASMSAVVVYESGTGHPVVPLAPSFLSEFAESMSTIAARLAAVDFAGISERATTLLDQLTAATADFDLARTATRVEGAAGAVEAFVADPALRGVVSSMSATLEDLRAMFASLKEATPELRDDLSRVLDEAAAALGQLNRTAASLDVFVGARSGLPEELAHTLESVQRAADALERFADYLERNPGALLRGRSDATPAKP